MGASGSDPSSTVGVARCIINNYLVSSLFFLGRDHDQAGHHQLELIQEEVEHTRIADRVRQKLPCSSGKTNYVDKIASFQFSLDLSRDVCNITSEMEARALWRPSITISPRVVTRVIYRVWPIMRPQDDDNSNAR